jgi:hypothetical protein
VREDILIVGELGSHALEELRLVLRRLARHHGVQLDVRIDTEAD